MADPCDVPRYYLSDPPRPCPTDEHPAVTARSDEEVKRYRDSRDIHVSGEGVPKPVTTFEEASFPGGWVSAGGG